MTTKQPDANQRTAESTFQISLQPKVVGVLLVFAKQTRFVLTDSTIAPPKISDFLQRTFHGCSTQRRIQLKTTHPYIFLCAEAYRSMTSGCRGTPYLRRYDLELVLKPAISFKKTRGDYRGTALFFFSTAAAAAAAVGRSHCSSEEHFKFLQKSCFLP